MNKFLYQKLHKEYLKIFVDDEMIGDEIIFESISEGLGEQYKTMLEMIREHFNEKLVHLCSSDDDNVIENNLRNHSLIIQDEMLTNISGQYLLVYMGIHKQTKCKWLEFGVGSPLSSAITDTYTTKACVEEIKRFYK